MKSANWRGWLQNFIDEIEGQIEVGTFHWAVAPEGHKVLSPLCVFTQKLHADFTHERGKCRVVVDQSRGKPGEYADVSAHVAQLASWKFQVGVCVELERASRTPETGPKPTWMQSTRRSNTCECPTAYYASIHG